MQNFLTIFFVVLGSYLSAQQMRIGVFYSKKISNLTLQVSSGEYRIFGDTTFLNIIGSGESINFKASGSIIFTITMLGFISLWSILIILAGIIAMVKGASINKKKKLKSSYVDLLDD